MLNLHNSRNNFKRLVGLVLALVGLAVVAGGFNKAGSLNRGNERLTAEGIAPSPTSYALAASPSTVNPGHDITVTWTAPSGQSALDWIGLYQVGDPDMGYSAWQHTGGTTSGSTTFTAPSQAGQYEFRYFTNNSYTKVATSNTVTVGAGGSNYPDASVPLSTDTTVTPDAAPTNTASINVSTSTNFKGKLEGNPATGVVRVTDAHPAGTYTVTVTAFDSGGATTTKTFELTVTTPATCNPVSFAAAVNFDAGNGVSSVAVGDFNGDGKQDLAVANVHSANVSILMGDGAGSFSGATNFGTSSAPISVAVGDFNGDGKQDLAVANQGSNNVSILLGDGAGSFSATTNFGAGLSPISVAIGDFDGDGKQDLAVANQGSENVSILMGDGAGGFAAATNFGEGRVPHPHSVAVGDFNGDGKQDLAVGSEGRVSILTGDGAGSFTATTALGGAVAYSIAVGDFNGDGIQDLAVGEASNSNVRVWMGNAAGSFSAATNFLINGFPFSVAVGDFNGDGKQDLATANGIGNSVSILLGDGAGSFATDGTFGVGDTNFSVAVGDFNGDGKQDLVTLNSVSNNASILLRNCAATPTPTPTPSPTPTADFALTASPSTVNPGEAITVTWTAPSGRPANDWIGLYKIGDSDMGYSAWQHTAGAPSGSTTFTAPSQTGQYEFRYFTNNSYNKVATSNTVTVGAGGSNYPDTSVPLSTDTTVTPDAAPTNTTSINVSTSTSFEGKLEGNPATGVVRVTNANPAGTYTVTVTAFDSGGATTTKTFELTVTTPATCNPVSFAVATNFEAGTFSSVVVGDFNGDGKQDLAFAYWDFNIVLIKLGDGAGSFSAATNFHRVGLSPHSLAVGDFNGDGKQDLVVANFNSNNVSILLGDGAGSFSAATNFGAGVGPNSVAVGDFNGDGKQDLAVVNLYSANVSILMGDGAGSFSAPTNFGVGAFPVSVAVGDFNGDGKQDLVTGNDNNLSILLGDGTGSFSAATNFGGRAGSVVVGDFNGDGKQDLAGGGIWLGDGNGNFAAVPNSGGGGGLLGDFNGDGKQDLAGGNSILLGDGAGRFSVTTFDLGGEGFGLLAVGDFNGDGKQDLAVTSGNPSKGKVSILLRDCAATPTPTPTPTPTVDFALTASPSTVNPGEGITVTWTAPSGRPANDWIGLYKVGDPDMGYSAWQHTAGAPSGSTTFTAPSQAGQYEFRYFTNNSYTKVATSNTVTVGGGP